MYEVFEPFIPFAVGFIFFTAAIKVFFAYLNWKMGEPFEAYNKNTGMLICPNIGGVSGKIIGIHFVEGDFVKKDQAIFTIESSLAVMEIPAPTSGRVKKLHVKLDQKISEKKELVEFICSS